MSRRLLILIGSVVIACGVVAVVVIIPRAGGSPISTYREQWEASGIDAYQMVVVITRLGSCRSEYKYIVRDEQVSEFLSGSTVCGTMLYTVSDLFDLIESTREARECGPNGCVCDGPIDVEVDYHPLLGYPMRILNRTFPERRWQYPDYWFGRVRGIGYTMIGYIGTEMTVEMLTPLP